MIPVEGVLIVDKPAGPTSHDIVKEIRRFTGGLRAGHTGTLDPFATGVLPVCIGRATRLARFLMAGRKLYAGTIKLGVTTDTYDIDGRVMSQAPVPALGHEMLRQAVSRFTGGLMQTPPRYSARKIGGLPMHRLARQGREVVPKPSPVTVYRFDITGIDGSLVRFEVETSPGTYVRSLAHDLGEMLGCGGCLAELRRLASGSFTVVDACGLEEALARGRDGTLAELVIPMRRIDLGLPSVTATSGGMAAMRRGRPLTAADFSPPRLTGSDPGPVRVEDELGNLLGVALPIRDTSGDEVLQPDVVLVT